jgi:signal transduction histidine kinase
VSFSLRRLFAVPTRPNPWTPPSLARAGAARWTAVNLLAAVLYFALGAIVSRFFAAYGVFPAPIWLPAGVATIAAMAGEARLLPGIFLGSFLLNGLLFEAPVHTTAIISLGNALGPVLGAMALRRMRPEKGLFTSFNGIIAFLVCTTFLSPAISATTGAIAEAAADLEQFYSLWVNWWLSDAGGTLYIAPTLVLWLGFERESDIYARTMKFHFDRQDLAVWAWIAAVSIVLFLTPPLRGTYIRSAFPFLLVVPLSWIALRMSLRSAYTLVTLVAIVATAGTVAGFGPFQDRVLANPLQLVGTLVVLLAMNVLTIVALVSERYEAENASKVKSMFLATTSHELRTPLNAIIGFSALIDREAMGPIANEAYVNYARLIHASGEHLLALINGLLDMSKIEAGRYDLKEEAVALEPIIAEVLSLIEVQAAPKRITLVTDLACGNVTLKADPKALRQILLNLLSNAVKFTAADGRVAIAASRSQRGELVLAVIDNGRGIAPAALERIFRPFERAHRDGEAPVEGTGLGLSITRGLVALHGGTVTLKSMVGKGTEAIVTLPANRILTVVSDDVAAPRRALAG